MSRWLPTVALGVLIAAIAAGALLGFGAGRRVGEADRARALAAELRCPDCQGLSVADSPTAAAGEIHRQIVELVDAGASDDEVRAHFVARYGEWILLSPTSTLAWVVPFAVLAAAVGGLLFWLVRRSSGTDPAAVATLTERQRHALRDEVEALDA